MSRLWLDTPIKHGQATESVDLYCIECNEQSWTVALLTEGHVPHTLRVEQRCDCQVSSTYVNEYIVGDAFRSVVCVPDYRSGRARQAISNVKE